MYLDAEDGSVLLDDQVPGVQRAVHLREEEDGVARRAPDAAG